MSVQTIVTAYGVSALETLRDVVRAAKHDDPMAPVTLLLPNNLAGIVARRHLAGGISDGDSSDGRAGVAGISLATLPRLAETLAAATLAPRRPATRPVVAAAWRAALDQAPGVFDPVKDHPATIRALVGAHRELRDLGEAALASVAGASRLAHDLVRLHRSVVGSLAPQWYDQTDLLDAARALMAGSLDATPALGALVLYLPQELTLAESRLARALTDDAHLTVVLGTTDVRRADRAVRRSLERLGQPFEGTRTKPRVAHEVFHASDSDDEVRCVVRDVVTTLETTPAHRVAVLYASTHPYARLLHEHLAAAGVTVNGAGTRPVVERSLGRGFLDVLSLAESDMPRADFFTAVSEAPTRTFDGGPLPTSRWERPSRSAAVVSGDDWDRRLLTHAGSLESQLVAEGEREDPYQSRIDGYRRDLDSVAALRDFATTLRRRLQQGLGLTTWSALSAWAGELFASLYGDPAALARLPAEEQYAATTVAGVIRGLADLDAFEETADLRGLVDVLTLELEAALPRVGRFGEGVLVSPSRRPSGSRSTCCTSWGWPRTHIPAGRVRTRSCSSGSATRVAASWRRTGTVSTRCTGTCSPPSTRHRAWWPRSRAATCGAAPGGCRAGGCSRPCAR